MKQDGSDAADAKGAVHAMWTEVAVSVFSLLTNKDFNTARLYYTGAVLCVWQTRGLKLGGQRRDRNPP